MSVLYTRLSYVLSLCDYKKISTFASNERIYCLDFESLAVIVAGCHYDVTHGPLCLFGITTRFYLSLSKMLEKSYRRASIEWTVHAE